MGFTINVTTNKKSVAAGEQIEVTLSTNNLNIGGQGMNAFTCVLDYDTNMFEDIKAENIKGLNGWSILGYNTVEKMILLKNTSMITTDSELCTITLTAKTGIEVKSSVLNIKNPQTSNGSIDISGTEASSTIYVKQISSEDYTVTDDYTITGVETNTTVESFKDKVSGSATTTIVDKNGNTISSGNIGTGATIKTESGEEYTVIVRGDINGDGKFSGTDISQLALHIVKMSILKEPYLTAADVNQDGKVTVTDISRMTAAIVGLMKL